jgi:hypothetical protein
LTCRQTASWYARTGLRFVGAYSAFTEDITEAHVRPRDLKTDWNIRATGAYAEGGSLSHIGMEVITCRTELGPIEFAVVRPDVPLMLHYLDLRKQVPQQK